MTLPTVDKSPLELPPGIIWDTEADNLLPDVKNMWSVHLIDEVSGTKGSFCDQPGYDGSVMDGIMYIVERTDRPIYGHNILDYDLRMVRKVRGIDMMAGREIGRNLFDTLVLCRAALPDPSDLDWRLKARGIMPGNMVGRQGIEAWGYRVGALKGKVGATKDFSKWTPEMQAYGDQDVVVNKAILDWIRTNGVLTVSASDLEHAAAMFCMAITDHGFKLSRPRAEALRQSLEVMEAEAEDYLAKACGSIWHKEDEYTPARVWTMPKLNKAGEVKVPAQPVKGTPICPASGKPLYEEGVPLTRIQYGPVNPGSREQLIRVLRQRYGWNPNRFTKTGRASLKDDDIDLLPVDEEFRTAISNAFKITKIKSYVWTTPTKNTKKLRGWLQITDAEDMVHGRINPCGCITARPAYMEPNIGQVPKVKKGKDGILKGIDGGFGYECRDVWEAPKGRVLVGSDVSGLELRMLAHFLFPYDQGAYMDVVLNGDVHTLNMELAGLSTRDAAKTFIYAWLYGAGDWLIGRFDPPKTDDEARALLDAAPDWVKRFAAKKLREEFGRPAKLSEIAICLKGRQIKENFFNRNPALAALKADMVTRSHGYLPIRFKPDASQRKETRPIVRRVFDKKAGQWQDKEQHKPLYVYTDASKRWWQDHDDGGYILGLDGRKVICRSDHSVLNYGLQGGGALVCKKWLQLTDDVLGRRGWRNAYPDGEYARHAWVHDEQNLSTRPDRDKVLIDACLEAAGLAGQFYNLRIPIAAEAASGRTWAEVH